MVRCLIIEDEPLAAEILQDYIARVPFLNLIGTFPNALAALESIHANNIDLLFLDIHLPGLKGLDFLKTLKNPPAVILTTAYHQYALQSYELSVVDYLLKPIEFSRFLDAVNKVPKAKSNTSGKPSLIIHRDKKTIIIPTDEILYLESKKEYVKIYCKETTHTTKAALSALEKELDATQFLRIHRSFIVAVNKIKAYSATEMEVNSKSIPIGGNYRDIVLERLKNQFNRSRNFF
jgi:DNA-binding LytR/AlgR family response regulator